MTTWNDSKPATANSVAADVADIEENFAYIKELFTYWFKTWSTSSAVIGKNSIYYVDPTAADQGATANARSLASIITAVGGTKKAIIYLPHLSADGNTTSYTVTTATTATSNFTLIVENGVVITGVGTLTVEGTIINLGDLVIDTDATLAIGATGYLYDLGPVTETGTLTVSGFRLTEIVSITFATASEINTGTSTTLTINPDKFAASNFGTRVISMVVFPYPVVPTTGDAKIVFPIPLELNGMDLIAAHAFTYATTSGETRINITRWRGAVTPNDMLSTPITIQSGEYSSYTAAIQPVIDTDYDDVQAAIGDAHDHLAIDVDAVGTGALGLGINLSFMLP